MIPPFHVDPASRSSVALLPPAAHPAVAFMEVSPS